MPDALKLTLKGQTLTRSLGNIADFSFTPAVLTGLEGWFNIGLDAARSRRNWAPGKPDATAFGAPIYSAAGHARFQSLASYLQTAALESDDITMMVVARSLDTRADLAHRGVFVSNYQGPAVADAEVNSEGAMLWVNGSSEAVRMQGYRRAADGSSTSNGSSNSVTVDLDSFACLFGVISGLDAEIHNMTDATSTDFTHTLPRYRAAQALRIGSAYSGAGGHSDIAHVAIWSRALTEGERTSVYEQVQEYQDSRFGVAI
jgi:hypothetical protein